MLTYAPRTKDNNFKIKLKNKYCMEKIRFYFSNYECTISDINF